MDRKTRAKFVDTVIQVVEQFAFMLAEEAPAGASGPGGDVCLVTMTYSGPKDGTISLALPRDLCRIMAANALGVDADRVKPADVEDTARELLNVITGRLAFELYGPTVVTELTVPELKKPSPKERAEHTERPDVIRFAVEGKIMAARLIIHDAT